MKKSSHPSMEDTTPKLSGTLAVLFGMVLMLLPVQLLAGMNTVNTVLDLAGYLLMVMGLWLLHNGCGGFGLAGLAAVCCIVGCVLSVVLPEVHLLHFVPALCYCLLLLAMCTSYAAVAKRLDDHHSAKHFISHMLMDICAIVLENVAHLLGLPEWVVYVLLGVSLYFEVMLMLHMFRFYKSHSGKPVSKLGGHAHA